MISHISIKDFAIIQKIDVDFHQGLNIITGETGAGKSIIIEAVSLALGSRADTAFVRSGKEKAIIQLVGEIDGEDIIITREVSTSGKSLCKVNDEIVSLAHLNKLCKKIADIHGQYDHQSLLSTENHIKLIDLYDVAAISPAKEQVSDLFLQYTNTKSELSTIIHNEADAEKKRDFMKFELQEITTSKLYIGEDEELSQRLLLLQNSEKIYHNLSKTYEILYDSVPSTIENLGKSLHLIQEISDFSDEIKGLEESLSDSYFKLEDLTTEVRKYRDSISFSPEVLEETINRLNILDNLKRKYGGSIEKIIEYQNTITLDLEKIENLDQRKSELAKNLAHIEEQLLEACQRLSNLRKQAAATIEEKINAELDELNFKNALLTISFTDINDNGCPSFTANGIDKVEFLITTNKGELAKPLAKIGSGGEISRIMLAFKRIIGDYDSIPTMIFDEIDSGISGITASIVGKKLLEISKGHQIICITHLPQIAAFGDHHCKIDKEIVDETTQTTVIPLSYEEKVMEIARLLGGINITDTTLKSAEELIKLSKNMP